MRISDWSSDVCSSDLVPGVEGDGAGQQLCRRAGAVARGHLRHLPRPPILPVDPDEMLEAARIDGAGEGAILRRIVLPVLTPIIVTLALFEIGRASCRERV